MTYLSGFNNYQFYATNEKYGVSVLSKINLFSDITKMKKNADIVIVSLHIGKNYETDISDAHNEYARYAIEVGTDAVICHSAHIPLPVEIYNGKPIFYSIGNFIFTTPGRFRYVDEVYHVGLGVNLIIEDKNISSIEITPFKTNNRVTNYQPCFLHSNENQVLFQMLLSTDINATIFDNYAVIHIDTNH